MKKNKFKKIIEGNFVCIKLGFEFIKFIISVFIDKTH
jgi:hypothetical protein